MNYLDSDSELEYHLRMGHGWTDEGFNELTGILNQVMIEYELAEDVPEEFFTLVHSSIPRIIDIISNVRFFGFRPEDVPEEDFALYIESRKHQLENLVGKFNNKYQ